MKSKLNSVIVIVLFLLIDVLALFTIIGIKSASADASSNFEDEFDSLFYATVSEVYEYENVSSAQFSAEKEIIYDVALNPLGFIYTFDIENKSGYAIVIDNGMLSVTEITTDAVQPYESEDTKVYVTIGTYWEFDGQTFYDCDTRLPVSRQAYDTVLDFAFFGALELYYGSEQISYTYRSENKYNILSSIPNYYYGLTSGCAAIAATNLIAYYDKYFTNLIPSYEPGIAFLGTYRFKTANDTTNDLTETLHHMMGTTAEGTTIPQFKNGLKAYVEGQQYSISYSSLMSFGKFNYERAKSTVQSNQAIALFLGGFRTTTIASSDGYDTLNYEYAYTNHVAAGFGCLEVNYTLESGQRTDKYVHCAMGVGIYRSGYINVATTQINEALVLNIG